MAIDLGDARTGIALCDKYEMLASPHSVIHERDKDVLLDKILEIITQEKIERIVLGYPKNINNTIGPRAHASEEFLEKIKAKTDIPAGLWDERLTTMEATEYLNATNTRGEKRKNVIDALAATLILEGYLEWRKNNEK